MGQGPGGVLSRVSSESLKPEPKHCVCGGEVGELPLPYVQALGCCDEDRGKEKRLEVFLKFMSNTMCEEKGWRLCTSAGGEAWLQMTLLVSLRPICPCGHKTSGRQPRSSQVVGVAGCGPAQGRSGAWKPVARPFVPDQPGFTPRASVCPPEALSAAQGRGWSPGGERRP